MSLINAKRTITDCENQNILLDRYSLNMECFLTGKNETEISDYLDQVLAIMAHAARGDHLHKGKIIPKDSEKLKARLDAGLSLCGERVAKAAAFSLNTMELNVSMGKIVASPTAGSCGVLPGVLMTLKDDLGLSQDQLKSGLLVANVIGQIVAKNATVSGAEGGCQAEVGTASAMAAGAAVFMMGGSIEEVFDSAAMCFKNLMGLVCDPVAGLVECPCAKRNALGSANALLCAEMALSGIKSTIPFDEVVDAMYRVGKAMPPSLRETAQGGLATTPTAKAIEKAIYG